MVQETNSYAHDKIRKQVGSLLSKWITTPIDNIPN